jgi:hypothetical protein
VVPGDATCGARTGKDYLVPVARFQIPILILDGKVAHAGISICDDNHNSNSSNSIEYTYKTKKNPNAISFSFIMSSSCSTQSKEFPVVQMRLIAQRCCHGYWTHRAHQFANAIKSWNGNPPIMICRTRR